MQRHTISLLGRLAMRTRPTSAIRLPLVSSSLSSCFSRGESTRLLATASELPPTDTINNNDNVSKEIKALHDSKLENPQNVIPPAIFAFATRLGLGDMDPQVILQSVTHKSYAHGSVATSERLEFIGSKAITLFVAEHLHLKYPVLPTETLSDALQAYAGHATLATIAKEVGLNKVMRWKVASSESDSRKGEEKVMARLFRSLIGGIYHQKGSKAAREFSHQHILSRKVDVEALLPLSEPKRFLSALMKRKNMPAPVSRLLKETGRASNAPVFSVGVYSGTKRLGFGYGSSLRMAEHCAAKDALSKYYMTEIKNFNYPSDFESMDAEDTISFFPQPLGDTQVIL